MSKRMGPGFEQEGARGGRWGGGRIIFLEGTGFGQDFFSSRPQYGVLGSGISRSNRFVRTPSSGVGSNASRPALSFPHLNVKADGY